MNDDRYGPTRPFDALNPRGLAGKREYVRGLEQRGDAQALALLVECLCDESWYLRDLAEAALLRLGERGAPVLLPLLEQGLWFSRTSAARVLGRTAYRPAVRSLLPLADDANATVAEAAREALVAIARTGGGVSVARGLALLPSEARQRRVEEIRLKDRHLMERIERLMAHDDLMTHEDDSLTDDSPMVRAHEDGLEWEVLTGPAPLTPVTSPGPEGPRAESLRD